MCNTEKVKKFKKLQNPIIFIGTGRSGTTIISEIISRHPDLAYPSQYQQSYPKRKYINLLRLVFDNPLWRLFGQKKQLNKGSLNKVTFLNKKYFRPSEAYKMWDYITGEEIDFSRSFLLKESLSKERLYFIREYFNSMVKFQNKKRLMFKITGPSRITFLLKIFPDAIFINLKRNKISTISSFLNVVFWKTRGINKLWWTGVYDENEQEWALKNSENGALITAFQLNKIDLVTEIERKSLQPKFLEINYEDFVADPEKELKSIIDFTGLSSFDCQKHLKKIKIYNGNKKDIDYFNQDELKMIYQIIRRK